MSSKCLFHRTFGKVTRRVSNTQLPTKSAHVHAVRIKQWNSKMSSQKYSPDIVVVSNEEKESHLDYLQEKIAEDVVTVDKEESQGKKEDAEEKVDQKEDKEAKKETQALTEKEEENSKMH